MTTPTALGYDARRYTDRDVRESGALRDFAFWYVEHYTGDYDYLTVFHKQIVEGNRRGLSTAEARAILNCARHDPDYASQIPPKPPRPQFQPPRAYPTRPQAHPALRQRPARVVVAATFKGFYVRSTTKLASASHILRNERSELVYFPYIDEWSPYVKTWCGKLMSHKSMAFGDDVPEGYHECNQCRLNYEKYGELSNV
jgi:hypothetical protein